MRIGMLTAFVVVVAGLGACTTTGNTPATAPTSAPSTTPTTPTTVRPPSTTTSSTATTTTIDRLTEVTAILEDLERRRLAAIYAGDVEAFTALFADTPYLERSLEVFDLVEPGTPPEITIEVIEILRDDDVCLGIYYTASTTERGESTPATAVLMLEAGQYKYAYTSDGKGGWLCDGPHPLS